MGEICNFKLKESFCFQLTLNGQSKFWIFVSFLFSGSASASLTSCPVSLGVSCGSDSMLPAGGVWLRYLAISAFAQNSRTGIWRVEGLALIIDIPFYPPISGIQRSIKIRSGLRRSISLITLSHLDNVSTRYCLFFKIVLHKSKISSSSSYIKMHLATIVLQRLKLNFRKT